MNTHKKQLPAKVTQTTSLLWRVVSQAVILTTFVIVSFATVSFIASRALIEESARQQLSSIAAVAEDAVEESMSVNRERASLIAEHLVIDRILAGEANTNSFEALFEEQREERGDLLGMELYDAKGNTLARAGEPIDASMRSLQGSVISPTVGHTGWSSYDIFIPVEESGRPVGFLVVRLGTEILLTQLLEIVRSLGEDAEMQLSTEWAGEIVLMHQSLTENDSYALSLGAANDPNLAVLAPVRAIRSEEGIGRFTDYKGSDVFASYRYLPALGWGLTVQMEADAVLDGVRSLAVTYGAVGGLFILLAGALSYLLATRLTGPLRSLTSKVRDLRPDHWKVSRTVHTGDEVEVLDRMVNEMAERLERVYEHLEEEIAVRTAELKKQYALDRTILEGMPQGVIAVDKQGLITGVNRAAQTQLGIDLDSAMGLEASKIMELCGHGGNELSIEHPVITCLETRTDVHSPANDHWSLRRKDGTLLPVLLVVTPLMDGNSIFGALVVFQDITEERRIDYMKSEFISLASHQLRTPLSAMRWYVELFEEEKRNLNKEQQGYLKEMDHALKRMVTLLASLLHAAHLEGEGVKPEIRQIDLVSLVREMEQDALTVIHESGHTYRITLPDTSVMIMSDPTLLRIVLQNLLNNALKYSAKGSEITVSLIPNDKNVVFKIEDKGYGIPAEEQKRIFQRFFRAKNIRKMDTDGNGLGLYITHSIVERLGGTISFVSKENEGTTFTVTLPMKGKIK